MATLLFLAMGSAVAGEYGSSLVPAAIFSGVRVDSSLSRQAGRERWDKITVPAFGAIFLVIAAIFF